jgi:hypothetical protein
LASSEVATEILGVRLPTGAGPVEDVQRQAALLDDEPGPFALRGEEGFNQRGQTR